MDHLKSFFLEEDAMGTLEVVLISAVLIGAAILFKGKIMEIINQMTTDLSNKATDSIN